MLSGEAASTSYTVFGLTQPGLKFMITLKMGMLTITPPICLWFDSTGAQTHDHIQDGHANHYTTDLSLV
jgi:hypothetical protein